ncbi:MAG: ATP-dependent helicase [Verrucomicrobiae bacterium]|nr:ATP-dependent helicase [Verrucomicrobiae bacterium]
MTEEYILRTPSAGRRLKVDYERELNPQQLAVVTAGDGPLLVIAGAGSGKTRTLTYRVAWLVEHGVAPWRVLLLTFTNKAAREMVNRVASLLPTDVSAIWGGTFHHVGHRLLRRHAELLGLSRDFTILDREDQKALLDACLDDAKIDVRHDRFPKPEVLAEMFSLAVNTGRSLADVLTDQWDYFLHLQDGIEKIRRAYEQRKRSGNLLDYDDLLARPLTLLREHPSLAERYREQFLHILVDEYQDTNRLQADFVDVIAQPRCNLMVVGDDAQAIYSWRGADHRNILEFPRRYPQTKIFKIEWNYRSVPGVLTLANAVMHDQPHTFTKTLTPTRKGGGKPWSVACVDADQQAKFVAQRIQELRAEGIALNEIAVLYRAHYQAMELQLELTRQQIPYVITSGLRFFEQAHIKDIACFLRLAVNPHDEVSFLRLAQLVTGIGPASAQRLWTDVATSLREEPPAKLAHHGERGRDSDRILRERLQRLPVPKKAAPEWQRLATTLAKVVSTYREGRMATDAASTKESPQEQAPLPATVSTTTPDELLELAEEGFYADYAKRKFPNATQRLEDIHQLALFATQFGSVEEFLGQLALLTNVEAEDANWEQNRSRECVRLSTVHQAKGQEWRVVFVIGLGDGLFPLARSLEKPGAEEEEQRLFYVAVTRARDELYLTYPMFRANGDGGSFLRPSRFVAQLPRDVYRELSLRHEFREW